MTTKNILTFVFIAFLFPYFSFSQNLNRMKEKKRNEMLIKIATEAIRTYMPGYYREYDAPIISKYIFTKEDKSTQSHSEFGIRAGRTLYTVTFPTDKRIEYFNNGFAAEIDIWGDTGDIYSITSGNHYGGKVFKDKEARTLKKKIFPYIKAERPTQYTTVKKLTPEERKEQWEKLVKEYRKEQEEKKKQEEKEKEK